MLLSYFGLLLTCGRMNGKIVVLVHGSLVVGIAFASHEWDHTPIERMRILVKYNFALSIDDTFVFEQGPLAFANSRVEFNCPALTPSPSIPTSGTMMHSIMDAALPLPVISSPCSATR